MLNRRRLGEAERITVENYHTRDQIGHDETIKKSFSPLE